MIDYKPQLVEALKTLNYPVLYELFLNKDTPMPCISYYEADNSDFLAGDTIKYSNIKFYIKIWSYRVEELSLIALKVDNLLKPLGFTRDFTSELFKDGIGSKILRYKAIGRERESK